MNIEKYTQILANYNNVITYKTYDTNIIVIPFKEIKGINKYLLRISSFDKVIYNCKKPLIKAFKSFYRTDCITSVFLKNNSSHSVLMGNERILYSHPQGQVFLFITPFWVKNASCIQIRGTDASSNCSSSSASDNIFSHKNAIMFLDEFQIPHPGGSYYTKSRSSTSSSSSKTDIYMRICYIARDLNMLQDIYFEWNGVPNVGNYPFITNSTVLSISKFINPVPIQNFPNFPESVVKSTNLITKKLSRSNPNFLIQDILNTYLNSSGLVDNVGLFLEYPFEYNYENSCGNAEDGTCFIDKKISSNSKPQQYVAFYVNGLNPKRILQVRRPYDRYMEYENYVPNIDMHLWTKILYDPREILPDNISRVIIDNTILGYKYQDAFLCLGYPALSSFQVGNKIPPTTNSCGSKNLDTDCLLSPIDENHLKRDKNIHVIDEYPYDRTHKLYHIKHEHIRNDLWCLSRIDDKNYHYYYSNNTSSSCGISSGKNDEPPSKYPKKADPPSFVAKWLSFYDQNKDLRDLNFGTLDLFKLALILARHKICFKLKRGNKRELLLLSGEYEIRLEEPLVNYINEIRLLPVEGDNSTNYSCTTVTTRRDEGFNNNNNDDNDDENDSGCIIA